MIVSLEACPCHRPRGPGTSEEEERSLGAFSAPPPPPLLPSDSALCLKNKRKPCVFRDKTPTAGASPDGEAVRVSSPPGPLRRGRVSHTGPQGWKQNTVHTGPRRSPQTRNTSRPPGWGTDRRDPGRPGGDAVSFIGDRAQNPAPPHTQARSSLSQRLPPAQSSPGPHKCLRPRPWRPCQAPEALHPHHLWGPAPKHLLSTPRPALTLRGSLRKPQLLSAAR